MDKLFAVPVFIFGCAMISLLVHELSPILATVAGIWGTLYIQQKTVKKLAIPLFFLWPVSVIVIGFITLVALTLPAALIFGSPFLGYDVPSIF